MAKQDKSPAQRRSTVWSVRLALVPPLAVFVVGVTIALLWGTEDGYTRATAAALVSTAGPVAFAFEAGPLVRILVALGILVVFAALVRVTPLGRAKAWKILLGSLVWCAIGFVAFVMQASS